MTSFHLNVQFTLESKSKGYFESPTPLPSGAFLWVLVCLYVRGLIYSFPAVIYFIYLFVFFYLFNYFFTQEVAVVYVRELRAKLLDDLETGKYQSIAFSRQHSFSSLPLLDIKNSYLPDLFFFTLILMLLTSPFWSALFSYVFVLIELFKSGR